MARRASCIGFTGILFAASCFIGCGGNFSVTPPSPTPILNPKIKHIVIIMQENRTFDNMFNGFPGAETVQSGMSHGVVVPLQPVPLEHGPGMGNSHPDWWADWDNGKMDGFSRAGDPIPNLSYAYVPQDETIPYWTLAKAYTLADRMFQSNTGPSFAAHQYMIAAQSGNTDGNPTGTIWGCDATPETRVALLGPNGTDLPGVYPCFDYPTMADNLDTKGITWKFYAPPAGPDLIWSAFQAIRHIRFGPDWTKNLVSPETRVLADIRNGNLAQVTWIVPAGAFSDHAGPGATAEGPDWVASITNAIGQSQFWDSTAIFITWDDWGGWYDHVNPPQIDAMGLGFRVPLLVVSPYAKHGYISHRTHEVSGILKYTEEVFALTSLGQRDVAADDFADCFDFTQAPQPYTPIPVTFTPAYFQARMPSGPPDND